MQSPVLVQELFVEHGHLVSGQSLFRRLLIRVHIRCPLLVEPFIVLGPEIVVPLLHFVPHQAQFLRGLCFVGQYATDDGSQVGLLVGRANVVGGDLSTLWTIFDCELLGNCRRFNGTLRVLWMGERTWN